MFFLMFFWAIPSEGQPNTLFENSFSRLFNYLILNYIHLAPRICNKTLRNLGFWTSHQWYRVSHILLKFWLKMGYSHFWHQFVALGLIWAIICFWTIFTAYIIAYIAYRIPFSVDTKLWLFAFSGHTRHVLKSFCCFSATLKDIFAYF